MAEITDVLNARPRTGWDDARQAIMQGAVRLYEGVSAAEERERLATDEGARLARAVYDYIADPSGYGTDALAAARERFMGLHAANFVTSGAERNA